MNEDTHGLSKSTWTHHDFDQTGWHDAQLYAIAMEVADEGATAGWWLLLDLDYIVRWVEPRHPDTHFTFLRVRGCCEVLDDHDPQLRPFIQPPPVPRCGTSLRFL